MPASFHCGLVRPLPMRPMGAGGALRLPLRCSAAPCALPCRQAPADVKDRRGVVARERAQALARVGSPPVKDRV